jgi:C4-dicarboxylate-specific signal transduction histidine kinase
MNQSDSPDRMILPMVPPRGLLEAILEEIRRHFAERGIPDCDVRLDIADRHVLQADPATIRDILAGLLLRAFENASRPAASSDSPHVREIVVTSVEHATAIEIEVADSGPMSAVAPADAALESLVAAVGGALSVSACPEGGRAVTLRLPHRRLRRLAA